MIKKRVVIDKESLLMRRTDKAIGGRLLTRVLAHRELITTLCVLVCLGAGPSGASSSLARLKPFFQKGEQAYRQGRFEEAIDAFEKVVEIDPNFAPAFNALGLAHHAAGTRLEDVLWLFHVALEIDPNYAEAYNNMCQVLFEEKEFEQARDACLKALEINPSLGQVELRLAWIYLAGLTQPKEAISYFKRVLAKVKSPKIYYGLGLAYAMNNEQPRALEVITTLKQMGEEELAYQLENTVRRSQPLSIPQPQVFERPRPQAGTLVTAHPQPPVSSSTDRPVSRPVSGQMRVRLRGRITPAPVRVQPSPSGITPPSEDDDFEPISTAYHSSGGRTAEERIRILQRIRAGLATGGTQVNY